MEQATTSNGDCIKSCDDVPKQYKLPVAVTVTLCRHLNFNWSGTKMQPVRSTGFCQLSSKDCAIATQCASVKYYHCNWTCHIDEPLNGSVPLSRRFREWITLGNLPSCNFATEFPITLDRLIAPRLRNARGVSRLKPNAEPRTFHFRRSKIYETQNPISPPSPKNLLSCICGRTRCGSLHPL